MTINNLVYLDNNATTKVDERVLEAMMPYLKKNMQILLVCTILQNILLMQ